MLNERLLAKKLSLARLFSSFFSISETEIEQLGGGGKAAPL